MVGTRVRTQLDDGRFVEGTTTAVGGIRGDVLRMDWDDNVTTYELRQDFLISWWEA